MAIDPSDVRFAVSRDGWQIAVRNHPSDSWFVAKFNEVRGRHQSDVPGDWILYAPISDRDRAADALDGIGELMDEAVSNLAWLRDHLPAAEPAGGAS